MEFFEHCFCNSGPDCELHAMWNAPKVLGRAATTLDPGYVASGSRKNSILPDKWGLSIMLLNFIYFIKLFSMNEPIMFYKVEVT